MSSGCKDVNIDLRKDLDEYINNFGNNYSDA